MIDPKNYGLETMDEVINMFDEIVRAQKAWDRGYRKGQEDLLKDQKEELDKQ